MRILLMILMVCVSMPSYAWIINTSKNPDVPDQQCYKRCMYQEIDKHGSGTNAKDFCFKDCQRIKKERLELGLDYKGYLIKKHRERWQEDNPRSDAYYVAVANGAQCFKDCIREIYDEDACDDRCDGAKEDCIRDCVSDGRPQKECFMDCGNLDPFGNDPWDFDGYNYQELTKEQIDHVRMLDYDGKKAFIKNLNQTVPIERNERAERPDTRGRTSRKSRTSVNVPERTDIQSKTGKAKILPNEKKDKTKDRW